MTRGIPPADTADEFEFLHSCGIGVRDIVKGLGISPKSLERALYRAQRTDLIPILRRAYLAPQWDGDGALTDRDRVPCQRCGRMFAMSSSHLRGGQCTTVPVGQVA